MTMWAEFKNFKSNESAQKVLKILPELEWITIMIVTIGYISGFVGAYHLLTGQWCFYTYFWALILFAFGGIGQSVAGHRLFSHKSFKVTRGLKRFLIFCHLLSGQQSLMLWCRSHRAHHKFTDTEKDPTNVNKGFLFAHFYWMFWYSPEVNKGMDSVDVSDLMSDQDVMLEVNYYYRLFTVFTVVIPTLVPYLFWNESLIIAFCANACRWVLNFNQLALANSLIHMKGTKPYDNRISACENKFINFYIFGEGYHNYHHVFPWDYKAAEFGDLIHWNLSAVIIDIFHMLGLVFDRKVVTSEMITKRIARTGDGSYDPLNIQKNPKLRKGDIDVDIDVENVEIHFHYKSDYFKDE